MKHIPRLLLLLFFTSPLFAQKATYGVDTTFFIEHPVGYTPLEIIGIKESLLLVEYQKWPDTQAFAVFSIETQSIINLTEFNTKTAYGGLARDTLFFFHSSGISTLALPSLILNKRDAVFSNSRLLEFDSSENMAVLFDSLHNSLISYNLNTNQTQKLLQLDTTFSFFDFCLIEDGSLLATHEADKAISQVILYNKDFEIEKQNQWIGFPGMGNARSLEVKQIPDTDQFLLEFTNSFYGPNYPKFLLDKDLSFQNIPGFYHYRAQLTRSKEYFVPTKDNQGWESGDSEIWLRSKAISFTWMAGSYYSVDDSGIRRLIGGRIYLDLQKPPQTRRHHYLEKFTVISYETNSMYVPELTVQGPGYFRNDTLYFEAAGLFTVSGKVKDQTEKTEEITVQVSKSNPSLGSGLYQCEKANLWNTLDDLPLQSRIKLNNPYSLEYDVMISGGTGYLENELLTINRFDEEEIKVTFTTKETDKFYSASITCTYYFFRPSSENKTYLFPNPVPANQFYIVFPKDIRDTEPKISIYTEMGYKIPSRFYVYSPYKVRVYIDAPMKPGLYLVRAGDATLRMIKEK